MKVSNFAFAAAAILLLALILGCTQQPSQPSGKAGQPSVAPPAQQPPLVPSPQQMKAEEEKKELDGLDSTLEDSIADLDQLK